MMRLRRQVAAHVHDEEVLNEHIKQLEQERSNRHTDFKWELEQTGHGASMSKARGDYAKGHRRFSPY
jgi:hypothetical protein